MLQNWASMDSVLHVALLGWDAEQCIPSLFNAFGSSVVCTVWHVLFEMGSNIHLVFMPSSRCDLFDKWNVPAVPDGGLGGASPGSGAKASGSTFRLLGLDGMVQLLWSWGECMTLLRLNRVTGVSVLVIIEDDNAIMMCGCWLDLIVPSPEHVKKMWN